MEILTFANALVFIVVSAICVFIGLDLKKWSSWFLGLYGFLSGLLFGFLRSGLLLGLQGGALLAFVALFGGGMTYRNRRLYTKADLQAARDNFDKIHAAAEKSRDEKARKNRS